MPAQLTMPALSPTMEKGTIARWLVAVGDVLTPGMVVAEVETDKATMEIEAVDEGRVTSLMVAEGTDDVAVGTVIALLATADEPVVEEALGAVAGPVGPAPDAPATFALTASPTVSSNDAPCPRSSPADRITVSPLARRIAEAKRIDLAGIVGTGPNGRVVRADLDSGLFGAPTMPAAVTAASKPDAAGIAPPPAGVPSHAEKLSSMRRTIARRLTESKQTVPHFYLTARCLLDPLLALRTELNEVFAPGGIRVSVNDMMVKGLALALVEVPDAHVQFGGDVLHRFERVDVAVAVAVNGGLVTPVLRGADTASLRAIAASTRSLSERARQGALAPADLADGTVTLSNLGMYGIDEMVPVINPPQALILGVGAGVRQPWDVDGAIGLATTVSITASFDHRAIDGAAAARFMVALKQLIEQPLLLCT